MPKRQFGLLGKNISYSFSKKYFTEKFSLEKLDECAYDNFDVQTIQEFSNVIKNNSNLKGLSVTIPYKESVIPYLSKLSKNAGKIGAVNTIKITKTGKLIGYNTDYYGFKKSLKPLLQPHHKNALILGTGGASKAVAFALEKLGIAYSFVSREKKDGVFSYSQINDEIFKYHPLIINTTPLGTSPNTSEFPPVPFEFFTNKHIAFDLIYNPEQTLFLKKAKENGAITKNGCEMLAFQAEKAWKIWNK